MCNEFEIVCEIILLSFTINTILLLLIFEIFKIKNIIFQTHHTKLLII